MSIAPLDASRLTIERKSAPKPLGDLTHVKFGSIKTNHMLTCKWHSETGWGTPEIKPYAPLELDPASCVFHYAFECFEGLKAFKDAEGNVRIFRPENNMRRLNSSCERICLPSFDTMEAVKLLNEFVKVEKDLVPTQKGSSLYLRPTMIGTQDTLGVGPPDSALFFIIGSPVGPYYPTGFKAVRLEATDYAVRAWPGGAGNKKLGANYAPCIKAQREAAQRGCQQNLWLFEGYLTEAGTMNLFVVFENEDGSKELCTPPLDGTILEGITRLSILELARERLGSEWSVNERKIHMDEVLERSKAGKLLEMFGSGTAAVVSPIRAVLYHSMEIAVPIPEGKETGPTAELLSGWIKDIQYGVEQHAFCPVVGAGPAAAAASTH